MTDNAFRYWKQIFSEAVTYTEELLRDQYAVDLPGDKRVRLLNALRVSRTKLAVIFGPEVIDKGIVELEGEINAKEASE